MNSQQVMRELRLENNELKNLNEKLVQKIDELNAIIEQEASAHSYYYNYPPKTDGQDNGIE